MTVPVHTKPQREEPRCIVLGIDPGTRVVGYGALVDGPRGPRLYAAGVLRGARDANVPARLAQIRRDLDELIAKLTPTVVVVELAFMARNVQSAFRMGEGRGVVLACAAAVGAEVVQLAPAVAKKALVGHGAADKTQVARMVARVLGVAEIDLPLDATDALALALAHLQRRRLDLLTSSARRSAAPGAPIRTGKSGRG